MHLGLLPAGLGTSGLAARRARFIADCGWGEVDTVRAGFAARDAQLARASRRGAIVLWFEHDLYDQLQLLQILDRLAARGPARCSQSRHSPDRLSLIGIDRHPKHPNFHGLGQLRPAELAALHPGRQALGGPQLAYARAAWAACRALDPTALTAFAGEAVAPLPFVPAALRRLLQEYPEPRSGLSRTQRQILEALAPGPLLPAALFEANQTREEARFMGDWPFWREVAALADPPCALLETTTGRPFRHPPVQVRADEARDMATFATTPLRLTGEGRVALTGGLDWLYARCPRRWIGGVELHPGHYWRWDGQALTRG